MVARLQTAFILLALVLPSAIVGSARVAHAVPERVALAQVAAPADQPATPVLEPAAFLAGGAVRNVVPAGEFVLVSRGNALEVWQTSTGKAVGFNALPGIVSAFAIERPDGAPPGEQRASTTEPAGTHRLIVVVHAAGLSVLAMEADGRLRTMAHHDGAALFPGGLPVGQRLSWHRGIAMADGFLYLVRTGGFGDMRNDQAVLVVLALSPDGSLDLVGEQGIGVGGVRWMVVQGERLYGNLGVGGSMGSSASSLWVADISRRHAPGLERLQVHGEDGEGTGFSFIAGMAIQDGHLIVIDPGPTQSGLRPDKPATLRVIDPSEPSHAREVARIGVEHVPLALAVEGRRALVLTYASVHGTAQREPKVLLRIDLDRVTDPKIVARQALAHGATTLAMRGEQAVLGTQGGDLAFYDLSAEGAARLRHMRLGPGAARQVAADGGLAVVLREDGRGMADVDVLDVRNPLRPRIVARIADIAGESHVALRGRLLVLVDGDEQRSELRVFDLSDSAAPVALGALDWQPPEARNGIQSLAWRDEHSLVVSSRDRLGLIDLSDPTTPRLERSIQHGAEGGERLAVSGGLVLVAAAQGTRVTLLTLDGEPGLLRRSIPLPQEYEGTDPIQLALFGERAWIAHGHQLHLYGFEGSQRSPRWVRTVDDFITGQFARVALDRLGDRLLVVQDRQLALYDTSDDGDLRLRQELTLAGRIEWLAADGALVYAANGDGGLQLFTARPKVLPWRIALPLTMAGH